MNPDPAGVGRGTNAPTVDYVTLVINLAASENRLAYQKRQFEYLGQPFSRIEAIPGEAIPDADYRRMRASGARLLGRNQVGCTLSHSLCWETCVSQGKAALVLEDDAVVDPVLFEVIGKVAARLEGNWLVNAQFRPDRRRLGRRAHHFADAGIGLFELIKNDGGAAGYIVSPGAARILRDITRRQVYLADTIINLPLRISYFQLSPAPVVALNKIVSGRYSDISRSTVGARRNEFPPWQSTLANPATRLRRLRTNVHRWIRAARGRGRRSDENFRPTSYLRARMESGQAEPE